MHPNSDPRLLDRDNIKDALITQRRHLLHIVDRMHSPDSLANDWPAREHNFHNLKVMHIELTELLQDPTRFERSDIESINTLIQDIETVLDAKEIEDLHTHHQQYVKSIIGLLDAEGRKLDKKNEEREQLKRWDPEHHYHEWSSEIETYALYHREAHREIEKLEGNLQKYGNDTPPGRGGLLHGITSSRIDQIRADHEKHIEVVQQAKKRINTFASNTSKAELEHVEALKTLETNIKPKIDEFEKLCRQESDIHETIKKLEAIIGSVQAVRKFYVHHHSQEKTKRIENALMGRLHTILMAELEKLNTQSVKDLATGHMINRSQYQQLRKITRACQEIGKFMGWKKTYEMSGDDPRARCDRVLRRLLTTELHVNSRNPLKGTASRRHQDIKEFCEKWREVGCSPDFRDTVWSIVLDFPAGHVRP